MSEMVANVDVVCGDGLHQLGDETELEGRISSMMGKVVWDWSSSMVRSIM